jgi:hypothetical protein
MIKIMNTTHQISNPIIVLGRPRSGSTLFTRLLNESSDLCVINDFYYLQYVDSLAGFSRQDTTLTDELAQKIFLTLKNRQKPDEQNKAGVRFGNFLTPQQVRDLDAYVKQCSREGDHNWSSLFSKIMQYNANLVGKKIWGYNTPQDYLHLPKLQQAFPHAKFIFVMRDPREVLRSYKYVEYLEHYHDPARYHPVLQSIAWKSAIESFSKNQQHDNEKFMLVRYEDIVEDANQVLAEVGEFMGISFPSVDIKDFGNNSTFKNKTKTRCKLSNTEVWLCEQIIKQEMQTMGYEPKHIKPSFRDLGEMYKLTQRAFMFYLRNAIASNDVRKRILNLAKARLVDPLSD